MEQIIDAFFKSWAMEEGNVNKINDLIAWIKLLNENTYVDIKECSIHDSTFWFYDNYNGEILNRNRSFFSIKGMRRFVDNKFIDEQPIIIQPEIGYLGIICKEINGVINFLMQAKIEPGNVNCVQISPTIQATKSNFTRAHGGSRPAYLYYFENSTKYNVIYDQIQSEQSARFYKKRNRNMIMLVNEDIEVLPNFAWMTLGQIKKLMEIDNLVNMDTRTVLSGLPFVNVNLNKQNIQYFTDISLYNSIYFGDIFNQLPKIYSRINNYKMFHDVHITGVPLNQLIDWTVDEFGITCKKQADFMVRFYDIQISGREVQQWIQPLFKAIGKATFGLLTCIDNGKRQFLIKIRPEIGCFDNIELGPSIHWDPSHVLYCDDVVDTLFRKKIESNENCLIDVILSEEGGRFYHEQNRNVIVECDKDDLKKLPNEYIWVDYGTLNYLVQINNCLNIQLRNLLSLINL